MRLIGCDYTSRKALCVGIDFYKYPRWELKGCVRDARDVREALMVNGDGTPNFDVKMLVSQDRCSVSRKDLIGSIRELFQGDCDVCLLYFSGHGYVNDIEGYLVTSDCTDGYDGLSFHDLMNIASMSPARNNVIILDCCYSGAAGSTEFGNIKLFGDFSIIKEGVIVLAACRGDQSAFEECGHGVFTKLLLDALKVETDLFGNVTMGRVYEYIDKALDTSVQRPVFKANVDSFVPLRRNEPPIAFEILRELVVYFKKAEDKYQLDPTYESESGKGEEEHVRVLNKLRDYYRVGLVRPCGTKYMYHAAMGRGSCELTPLGKCYWNLVRRGRVLGSVGVRYKLFISHSWRYSKEYDGLRRLLDSCGYFEYSDYSVPRGDPFPNMSDERLVEEIRGQMAPASCILIMAGVYAGYSKWMNVEIDLAKHGFKNPKKIIAIERWGAERTSAVVKDAADRVVKWNTKSIVDAIREVCKD